MFSTRGLRQDDPLSLFLFLLVAEALQISILEACSKGFFKCIHLANSGASLSLLQYADDALFFGEWIRVPADDAVFVVSSLGCSHDSLPFIYLKLPVGKRMNLCDGWVDVINRFRDRLTAWKAKSLSNGGRLTLVKSVLGSLLVYFVSLYKAPVKSIPHEQNKGGLGVGSILVKNISLLGKWKRRYLSEPNALWRIVIKDFYGNDGGFGSNPTPSGCGGDDPWWFGIGSRLKDIFPRLYALELDKSSKVTDRWKLLNDVWGGNWSWRLPSRGRVIEGLSSLVSLIGNLAQPDVGMDK
ncbi:hypothetical protein Tco_1171407 [Tanacetum coccineum]